MSRKFLTPVGLPSGSTVPAAGSAGDLFFKTTDTTVYAHDGTSWVAQKTAAGEGGNIDGGTSGSVYGGTTPIDGGDSGSF